MEPNFHNNEYIIIDKLSYKVRPVHRGEVVVLHPPVDPGQNYIKRVVGLPGETIAIKEGEVYINNHLLQESYLGPEDHKTEPFNLATPLALQSNEYFVMGDNREHSSDSREWGVLKKDNIEGRTWVIVLPFQNFAAVKAPIYPPTFQSFLPLIPKYN